MQVSILLCSFNNSGDNGVNEIEAVCHSLRDAQIALCDCINRDEQYGGYEHMEANTDLSNFDLHEAARLGLPIPCTYIRYWDGEHFNDSERTLEYTIDTHDVISYQNHNERNEHKKTHRKHRRNSI